jgi:hypothetical protein
MTYTCPVCGYEELPSPPEDWMICPCCNTMFGYSDENWGSELLRREWIEAGAKWGSRDVHQPIFWSPIRQLLNIGYQVTDAEKILITRVSDNDTNLLFFETIDVQNMLKSSVRILPDLQGATITIPNKTIYKNQLSSNINSQYLYQRLV